MQETCRNGSRMHGWFPACTSEVALPEFINKTVGLSKKDKR